jgi:hypothetical protein
MSTERTYTAFAGQDHLVTGDLESMLRATKALMDTGSEAQVLIFDDSTGKQIDYDFRGTPDDVVTRYAEPAPARGPGRPKLGVVSREVTLLPRHWEWLAEQPRGASATLRRLVDEARRSEDEGRLAAAVTGRVMTALAGDLPDYEEAYRALDAGNEVRFLELTMRWPEDVRQYLLRLAAAAFAE